MFFSCFLLLLIPSLIKGSPLVNSIAELQNEEPDIFRLADEVVPVSYVLRIIPNLQAATFTGKVEILVEVKFATYVIKLHSKNLKIINYELKRDGKDVINCKLSFDVKRDLALIEAEQKLYSSKYNLAFSFEGTMNNNFVGLYNSSYIVNGQKKLLALTQFEPNHAREAFPCFDDPRFLTPVTLLLIKGPYQTITSNMPYESSTTDQYGRWDKFRETPPIPIYLLSFMISDFQCTSLVEEKGTKVMVYSRPNDLAHTNYALRQVVKLFKVIQYSTGTLLHLPKIDLIAAPDMKHGAMHNYGMPTFREMYLLMDEASSSGTQKIMVTLASSHELACQWFGGMVNYRWWDDAWLNRAFSTYFEYYLADKIEPNCNLKELYVVEEIQFSLWEEIETPRAMTAPVTKASQLKYLNDVITWDKGSCIINMLEHIIGTDGIQCGLKNYFERGFKNQNTVTPQLLYAALEEQSCSNPVLPFQTTLTEVLRTWTDNIGYPLMNVTRDATTNKIRFVQSTYNSPRAPNILPDQEWIVPLTYTTKSALKFDTKPSLWSVGSKPVLSTEIVPASDWFLCNLQQSGYYRVMYDPLNWERLINQLKEDHEKIHVINRAQLIDDSMALSYDDILSYTIPLEMLKYLKKEIQIIPWLSAANHFNKMYTEFRETKYRDSIKTYIEKLIEKLYDHFGFKINPTDADIFKYGYPNILQLSCKMDTPRCIKDALQVYENNINDLDKIETDLKGVVFCTALAHSTAPEIVWDNLWKLYKKTNISYIKILILKKLGCARDEKLLKKVLEKVFNPYDVDIRNSEKKFVVDSFFETTYSTTAFLNFIKEQLSNIPKYEERSLILLDTMAQKLETRIENEEQLKLITLLKIEIEKLQEKRYDNLKKSISESHANGAKTVERVNFRINKIVSALIAMGDIKNPENPKKPSDKPQGHSGAQSLSSSWYSLIIVGYTIYYYVITSRLH